MIARTLSLSVCAVCIASVVACGGGRSSDLPPSTTDVNGGTGSDTDSDAGSGPADSDGALRPGVAFMQGYVECCEQGLGQSCCTAEEKDLGRCVEFLGCTPAGSVFIGKITCSKCCDGLAPTPRTKLVDGKCVSYPYIDDNNVCVPCGNGVCDTTAGENPCNCPADCGPPP